MYFCKHASRKILVALAMFVSAQASAYECMDYADPIRVMVGGTEFHIPEKYKPEFSDGTHGSVDPKNICTCRTSKDIAEGRLLRRSYCQKKEEPPPEINSIFFRQVFALQNGITFPLSKQLDITVSGYPEPVSPQKPFCSAKQRLNTNPQSWREYSEAPGFYEYIMRSGGVYYYSDEHRLWGMPVMVSCTKMKSAVSRAGGRQCFIYTSLGSRNALSIRFNDGYLPPSEWENTFKEIEKFIRTIMLTPPVVPEFTSCDPASNKE